MSETQFPEFHREHEEKSFEEALRDSLRSAPWIIVSAVAHAILFLILAQFDINVAPQERDDVILQATADAPPVEPIEPPPPPEKEEVVEEQEEQIEEPIVSEEITDEVTESEVISDLPLSDAPFEGTGNNDVIGVGGGAGGRGGGGLGGRRAGRGGGRASQKAVDLGLEWLKNHQDPDGHWSCAGFTAQCQQNRCQGDGDPQLDVGVTGIALLAFLGAGNTPNTGKYKNTVRKGLRWLIDHQNPETGLFGEANSHTEFLYDHAIATLAVTEGYGLSKWPQLQEPAQKAIHYIQAARNPYKAWRYAVPPNGEDDVSVTGWMVMALKSAKDFGLNVDTNALEGAKIVIDEMTDENTWRTGYISKGGFSSREPGATERWPHEKTEAMTAVAMLCRIFLGEDPDRSPALRGGADLLRKRLPLWDEKEGTIDYYYWYYGSYAMYQMGGQDWTVWEGKMKAAIIDTQRTDGDEVGSWDPQFDPWGRRGGRVYSTAIMTLCLEVFYRYDRVLGAR
jgi:hypothetical protein